MVLNMSYFIFLKNSDNVLNSLYKIAENQSDLNNINIDQSQYKIIENSQENFNSVKVGTLWADKYNNNSITFINISPLFKGELAMAGYIDECKHSIKIFLKSNQNHPLFNQWNSYYNQLSNFDVNSITYPFEKSLEQHFIDLGQPSYNILQLP